MTINENTAMTTPAASPPRRRKRPSFRNFIRSSRGHDAMHRAARIFQRIVGWLGPERGSAFGGRALRALAPLIRRRRLAEHNIEQVFPHLTRAERKRILDGMWDNLGRMAAESGHLDWISELDRDGRALRLEYRGADQVEALKSGGVGIIFSAHLGNWELVPHLAAKLGFRASILFRRPTQEQFAEVLDQLRGRSAGQLVDTKGRQALFTLAGALQRGEGIGVMMDVHVDEGIESAFLGRPALTSPIVGRMARLFECPVRGIRVVRLKDNRFAIEVTPPLDLPRDARGRIDAAGATAAVNAVIEGWIREHPEQWFWINDRWRRPRKKAMPARERSREAPVADGA